MRQSDQIFPIYGTYMYMYMYTCTHDYFCNYRIISNIGAGKKKFQGQRAPSIRAETITYRSKGCLHWGGGGGGGGGGAYLRN